MPHTNPQPSYKCESQLYTFLNPFNHAQLGHLPPPTLLVPLVGHDHTPQPTLISSTCLQLPPKLLCPTYGCQFISRRLAHHQHSCQTSNSSNPNLYDHHNLIPSLIPIPLALAWTWVSTLDVFKSFHLGFCYLHLYNHIPTAL